MDASAWGRLSRLLDEALDLSPGEREPWLATLTGEDAALRPRLEALLSHASPVEDSGFLDTIPRLDIGEIEGEDEPIEHAGATVGPYRVLRELGEGGMGSVWLAERTDGMINRTVALKLPRGSWSRAALAERLARERNILATLAHPHIARLYDAGVTAGGRPYLALEYIEGRPIDRYCRELRLDVRGILRVFLQVVRAVAYAHAKLIVHRDLKPSNILVTGDGEVRLLDFGIAKLLDDESTEQTDITQVAGCPHTPEYASPEQVTGEPLSTASDVYSLGVVLYELLTGARPYTLRRDSRRAMEEIILQTAVKPPSGLATDAAARRTLRGDLDTIVLKALKKVPDERYQTVTAFGDDLDRWLDGRPILARPDSRVYRFKRFIGRNRVATAAVSATAAVIITGAGISIWQAHEARVQRDVAVREKGRANTEAELARRAARIAQANAELTDYMTSDLAVGRSTTDLEQQLNRAVSMVNQRFGHDPLVRLNLLLGIAGRFRQLSNVDRHRQLLADLEKTPRTAGDDDLRAQLECWRARDFSQTGQASQARELMDRVLNELRARTPIPKPILLSCLADASAIARAVGDSARAIATVEEIKQIEEASGLGRTDGYSDTLLILSRAYSQAGRYRDAARAAERSLELRGEIGRGDTPGANNTRSIHATILREGGQPQRALPILENLFSQHVARGGAPQSNPALEYEIGLTLVRLGRVQESLPWLSRASAGAGERGDATLIRAAAVARILALSDAGDLTQAASLLKETESLYARLRADQQYTARQFLFAKAHLGLAQGNAAGVQEALDEARTIVAKLPNLKDPAWRSIHVYAARLALHQQRYEDARKAAGEALTLSQQQAIDPAGSIFVGEDLVTRALAYQALGDLERARDDARAAVPHLVAAEARAHPLLLRAQAIASLGK
jgi:serine/threonine-protein kinase